MRIALVLLLLVLGIGVALYAGSWRFRQSVLAMRDGLAPLKLSTTVERLIVREAPLLVADHYPASDAPTLVVLVHGSSRLGRRHWLVRTLATRLQQSGFAVLAIDLGGFGESADPPTPLEALAFEEDVALAATVARERGLVDAGRVAYVGHSLGAGVVLRAGRLEPRPSTVIALGAPPTARRYRNNGREWLDAFAAQRIRDMEIPSEPASIEAMAAYLLEMDIVRQMAQPGNPPVLVVKGELENSSAEQRRIARLPLREEDAAFLVIEGADHDYRIRAGPRGLGLVFHDPAVTDDLTRAMTEWLLAAD